MFFDDIFRLFLIIRVIFNYGLDEFIPSSKLILPFKLARKFLFKILNKHPKLDLGERLRLALQELGPVWIKFGQMLSTRRDIFSSSVVDQLEILQDQVEPFDGFLAREYIERAIGKPLEIWFEDFQLKPLASASISQVHTARLKKNRKEVVIKVIRPDILPIIKADIKLMYRLASWVPMLLSNGTRFRSMEVVLAYEKSLLNELNLLREAANTIQLRRNFKGSSMLYIPEVYTDYCSENIMVMERVYGIPVNNIVALELQGTNMKLLAERGVKILFTQIFRDSFFHADMHPGNIFISYDHPESPKYISIDCGIVGSLNKKDKYYLAENFIAFLHRDYRKVAELHVDSGWVPSNTNIEDFECAIRTVFEPIFEKPLEKISFSHVLLNLFHTARNFNMEVQPQLILLQKTLLYIEGIVRQLYPQLDLWKTAQPFLERWSKDQMGLFVMFRSLKEKIPYWADKLPEVPELMYDCFKQYQVLQKTIDRLILELGTRRILQNQAKFLFGIGYILIFTGIYIYINSDNKNILSAFFISIGIISWIIGWNKIN